MRAKRTLAAAKVPFEVPAAEARAARLASVLDVIYLVFNEGYAATAGDDWMRPALCDEALRLGRVLAGLAAQEAEVHGLVALMEIQASRAHARTDAEGRPGAAARPGPLHAGIALLIRRGLAALDRAGALAEQQGRSRGPYALQAAIAACHARTGTAAATDWSQIVALYDALAQVAPSPVVELNRAVAVGMAFGPAAALELVDALAGRAAHWRNTTGCPACAATCWPSSAGAAKRSDEFERAAALTRNARERAFLLERAARESAA